MAIIEEEDVEKQEEAEEEQSSTTVAFVNRSSKKTKIRHLSVPDEIVEEVLLRLPVESILRSTSVSKPWYSLISHPSFSKLQLTHATSAHRTAFFINAYDSSTGKRHYFSASAHGGPLNLLMSVDDKAPQFDSPSHLNGLVCFTSKTWIQELMNHSRPFVVNLTPLFINPSTRKIFKLPGIIRPAEFELFGHLYGVDDSTNHHKILLINTMASEFMVFDMSSHSWRQIEAEPPVGSTWDDFSQHLDGGVCFDSKVHVMIDDFSEQPFGILVFDFVTEKFSLMRLPQDAWPHIWDPDEVGTINNRPFIVKISDSLGVVVYDYERGEIHIWVLQDSQNGVWVKETVTLPEPWNALAHEILLSIDANMDDELIFNTGKVSENAMSVPVYNRKSKSFRSLEFTLDAQFLSSKTLRFHHIKYYVDNMVPV